MNNHKSQIKFADFDLLVEREGDGFWARVLNAPAGQASARFMLPISPVELENFCLKIGRPRRGVRRIDSPEMAAAKEFGKTLFDSVFRNEVLASFRSSLDQAEGKGLGLRIRLRLNAPELADLPWEFLYNSSLNRFLVLGVDTPIVRYLDLPQRLQPLKVVPPLNVLVVIASPTDVLKLDTGLEWQKLQDSLQTLVQRELVQLRRLEDATMPALMRELRREEFHILHFIGHGAFDESAQDGTLLFEDEFKRGVRVSGQKLGTLLHNHRSLRLAVLNACEGARTSRSDPFAGAAQSLVQQGIPAVIAMQFEISDQAAITFAEEFYAAIVDGYPVDAATVEARTAIFSQGNDVEWGTPVLYMRSPDGRIFDLPKMQEHVEERIASLLQEVEVDARREDWQAVIPKLNTILTWVPNHAEAKTIFQKAKTEQQLQNLYVEAHRHAQARRWQQAIDCLRRVSALRNHYKDTERLLAIAERELTNAGQRRTSTTKGRQAALKSRKYFIIATAVAAIIFIALLLPDIRQHFEKNGNDNSRELPAASQSDSSESTRVVPLEQQKRSLYATLISQGDSLMALGQYVNAKNKYEAALADTPGDPTAAGKIRSCVQQINAVRKNERYLSLRQEGDDYFRNGKYAEARNKYQTALQQKPGDVYADAQINACDSRIAAAAAESERHQRAAGFTREADGFFQQHEYSQAIGKYDAALALLPGDQYLQNQIKKCQDLLASAERDQKYNEFIGNAETLLKQGKFESAKGNFKDALAVRPGDKYASKMIQECEQRIEEAKFRVNEAVLYADPVALSGPCPVTVKFSGHITVNRSGNVSYRFLRSDGEAAPVQKLKFNSAGTKNVSTSWQLGKSYSGWQAIEIIEPQQLQSAKAEFKYRCEERVSLRKSPFYLPGDGKPNKNSKIGDFCCTGETATVLNSDGEAIGYIYYFDFRGGRMVSLTQSSATSLSVLVSGISSSKDARSPRVKNEVQFQAAELTPGFSRTVRAGALTYNVTIIEAQLTDNNSRYLMGTVKIKVDVSL